LYAVLIAGGVLMAFPFLWMIVTSFQSVQESLQATPVWLPNRINPAHWGAAQRLGAEGGDALWGGVAAGKTVTLEIVARGDGTSSNRAALQASVPTDSHSNATGFLFGDAGVATPADPRKVTVSAPRLEGNQISWRVAVQNAGQTDEAKLPLSITLPDGYTLLSTTLPPDRASRNDAGAVYEWSNVAPGLLGYILENYRDALRAAPFARYGYARSLCVRTH
jgi:multiple sugar transport system permease protein